MVSTNSTTEDLVAAVKALSESLPQLVSELESREDTYEQELDAFLSRLIGGLKPSLKYIDRPIERSSRRGVRLASAGPITRTDELYLTREGKLEHHVYPEYPNWQSGPVTTRYAVEHFGLGEIMRGLLDRYAEAFQKVSDRKPVLERNVAMLRRVEAASR